MCRNAEKCVMRLCAFSLGANVNYLNSKQTGNQEEHGRKTDSLTLN